MTIPDDLPGIDQANAELDRLMAAEPTAEDRASVDDATQGESANEGQRAGQQGAEAQTDKVKTETDTPATADPTKKEEGRTQNEAKEQGAKSQEQAKQQEPSRYQKARERQEKSWSELNSQKETLKREREEFDRLKTEHEARVKQATKEFSPEEYETAAKKFEAAGKFDLAEAAREKAAELRNNPPATPGNDPAAREWTLKAGIDFPEVAKTNSPTQQRVAQLLKEEPELKAHPKGIYLAARLASLEQDLARANAGAASVSAKDKQITELQAKIKELETFTAPGNGGAAIQTAAKSFAEKSDAEQYEELQQMARETGTLR